MLKNYCKRCCNEIPSDLIYCPFCGWHVETRKSKKKIIILIVTILSAIAILGVCAGFIIHRLDGSIWTNDEKLAYRNAVKMKSMVKNPDSFTILDEMYVLKHFDEDGNVDYTYTVFNYSYTNGSEGEKSDEAVFKNDKCVVSYSDQITANMAIRFYDSVGKDNGWKKVDINIDKVKKKMDKKVITNK